MVNNRKWCARQQVKDDYNNNKIEEDDTVRKKWLKKRRLAFVAVENKRFKSARWMNNDNEWKC